MCVFTKLLRNTVYTTPLLKVKSITNEKMQLFAILPCHFFVVQQRPFCVYFSDILHIGISS